MEIVSLLFEVWERADYHPNALPFPGGMLEQDPQLLEDFSTMLAGLAFQRQEYPEGVDEMFDELTQLHPKPDED